MAAGHIGTVEPSQPTSGFADRHPVARSSHRTQWIFALGVLWERGEERLFGMGSTPLALQDHGSLG
ncbi:uncharacterized protein N7459_005789 [Penicillium hispanicum]|uniref:uncharacterized protein n=1 Tax=Penicillium hispanicum TaxID=1080232 RepID=UPI002542532C|nr:uncharacterized protein N7459_005789 [Penicillium hispanicum]KAJ5579804.1 hypothetical protein N7459_005789 [Penicillium hispanicum]